MLKIRCKLVAMICLSGMLSFSIPPTAAFAYVQQDQKVVKGKVVEAKSGEAIIGASVFQKGTSNGVVTDLDGNYQITVPSGATLVFSSIGFLSKEVNFGSQDVLNITLEEDVLQLEESVVIGYGVQKKSDVTGAVIRVSDKDLTSRPISNALEGMQGKAAGVDITSNERPGETGSVNIRGVRSITASNSPLYVVDGIPLTTGGIDNLNPADIESIDVLKDASATAIYGSRGANGVIIVTTKQGKSGKLSVSYSGSVKIENLVDSEPAMTASEFIEYRRWSYYYKNPSVYPRADQPTIENDKIIFNATSDPYAWANIAKGWAGGKWDASKVSSTDWAGMIARTGITQDHTLSVSGGTDKMKSYLSVGYLDNLGTQQGQGYKRFTAKATVEINPIKWFTMGGTLNAKYSVQEYGASTKGTNLVTTGSDLYNWSKKLLSYAVPYDDEGNRIKYPGGDVQCTVVDEWLYSQDQRVSSRILGSLFAQIDLGSIIRPLEGLKYRFNFGPDINNYRDGVFVDGQSAIRSSGNYAYRQNTTTLSYTLDNLVYYDKSFGKNNIGVTLLHTMTGYNYESAALEAENIPFASQKWNALTTSNVSALKSWSSGLTEKQLMSYMARINYNYDQKYLLTVSSRWDGASQLAEGHKWAFFPSVALGWRMDKEDFMSNAIWINQLKLRAGFGVTGNAAIDPYATKGGLSSTFYPFGTSIVSGSTPSSSLANQSLGWEKTAQFNVGVDFSFFDNRLSGVVDVYKSRTSDLLLAMTIPTVTGYSSTNSNVGSTSNRGVDFTINSVNVVAGDFEWRTSLNASWSKSRIESLVTKDDDINNGWFVGEEIGVIYGFQGDGLWQESDAAEMKKFNDNGNNFNVGENKVVDQNGDHYIDANHDRVIIGNTRPHWVAGMTNDFSWKNFDLSIFLYGRFGYWYSDGGELMDGRNAMWSVDYYNENNKTGKYQRPFYTTGTQDPYYACIGYQKASFLKIRNISLGYTLPNSALKAIKAQNLRIYAQVINPGYVFSMIKNRDMDTGANVWNKGATIGVNVTF